MVICPSCGAQQPDDMFFCDMCGAALQRARGAGEAFSPSEGRTVMASATCPVCGARADPQDAFCTNCGASLRENRAPSRGTPSRREDMRGAGGEALPASQAVSDAPTVPGLQGGVSPVPKPDAPLVCCNCGARLAADSAFCDMCSEPVRAQGSAPAEGRTQVISPKDGSVQGAGEATRAPAPPALPRGRLKVRETAAELFLPLGETEVLIGREDPLSGIHPDIDLTDHGGDEGGVSRHHARIVIRGCQFIIEDLNSTNGTFVNRERVTFGQQRPLYDGDEIRLGRVIVTFCVD